MKIFTLPAPVKGLNATKVTSTLSPEEAITLDNLFPEDHYIRLRDGIAVHSNATLGSSKNVQTLASFVNMGGATTKLVAGANNAIYDVSSATPSVIALPASYSITVDYWEWTNFTDSGGNSYLVLCNGADIPLLFNGTTLAKTVWTGVTQTTLSVPLSYKGRMYFIENLSLSVWYGGTGISGVSSSALTEFDMRYVRTETTNL